MTRILSYSCCLLLMAFTMTSSRVYSQELKKDSLKFARPYKHAIHIMPTSLLFRNFNLGYEYLYKQKHAVELSGYYLTSGTSIGHALSLNYKRYKTVRNSYFFWGIFADYSNYHHTEVYENTTYEYTMKTIAVGPNLGMKWAWRSGFLITFRLGYGIPVWDYDWISSHPEDDLYANTTEFIEKALAGLDGELKIGWCF
jgi:hypothetical protein